MWMCNAGLQLYSILLNLMVFVAEGSQRPMQCVTSDIPSLCRLFHFAKVWLIGYVLAWSYLWKWWNSSMYSCGLYFCSAGSIWQITQTGKVPPIRNTKRQLCPKKRSWISSWLQIMHSQRISGYAYDYFCDNWWQSCWFTTIPKSLCCQDVGRHLFCIQTNYMMKLQD